MIDFLFKKFDKGNHALKIILALIFFYLALSVSWGLESASQKLVLTRYVLFLYAGFFAFIIPHLLFPDSRRYLIQSLNLSKPNLVTYTFRKIRSLIIIMAGILVLVNLPTQSFGTDEIIKSVFNIIYGLLITAGLLMISITKYAGIGKDSQAWQEGDKGARVLQSMQQIGMHSAIPSGSYPSLFITTLITAGGMLLVVFGAWISGVTGILWLEIAPAILLFFYSMGGLKKSIHLFDRLYYHTHSFYSELFLNPRAIRDNREPIKTEALYWVPTRWKTGVWFSLLQLDRKHPLGRILIVGHLLIWTLFYAGSTDMVIFTALILLILSKSAFVFRLTDVRFSPLNFQYRLMSPTDWVIVRFFVNLRWVPLLIVSLWIVSLFSIRVDWSFIGTWILIDIGISILTAFIATLRHEFNLKKYYA